MKKTLFTSYLCSKEEPIIQEIISKWKLLNPEFNVLYFSDDDINEFFRNTPHYNIYKKMRNGVAIADFFRIYYINKCGGLWFDIDIEPTKITIINDHNIQLFDCGYENISYMLIGGNPNQKLFNKVIFEVIKNIEKNIPNKYQHIMEITGPRIIQNIIFEIMKIENKDGCFKAPNEPKIYLKNTDYEFCYNKIVLKTTKTELYNKLQKKYKKERYQNYNYV